MQRMVVATKKMSGYLCKHQEMNKIYFDQLEKFISNTGAEGEEAEQIRKSQPHLDIDWSKHAKTILMEFDDTTIEYYSDEKVREDLLLSISADFGQIGTRFALIRNMLRPYDIQYVFGENIENEINLEIYPFKQRRLSPSEIILNSEELDNKSITFFQKCLANERYKQVFFATIFPERKTAIMTRHFQDWQTKKGQAIKE